MAKMSTPDQNPHVDALAMTNSCYTKWSDDALIYVGDGTPAPPLAGRVHDALRAVILDPEFPCVGARSAVNQASYRFAI